MRRAARLLRSLVFAAGIASVAASAQALENRATAALNGVPLDLARATVTLRLTGNAVTAVTAEISPNTAAAGVAGQDFIIDALARIGANDSGFDTLTIDAPSGWRNLSATRVSVDGAALRAGCPAAAGAYCATSSGASLVIGFGARIVDDGAHVQVAFDARTATEAGTADFAVSVDDASSPGMAAQASAGNADGDPGDANSLGVELTTIAADALRSEVTADPPIVRADGVVDVSVNDRRLAQVAPARQLPPALLEVERRDHLYERRENRVARGHRHRAVEADVVHQERLRVVDGREHPRHFLGHRGDLIAAGALGRQACHADLERPPRLEHLLRGETVQRRQQAQRPAVELRRSVRDVGARAMTRLHHAHGRQRPEAGAHTRTADADALCELTLRGKSIAGSQFGPLDPAADVIHHQLRRRPIRRPEIPFVTDHDRLPSSLISRRLPVRPPSLVLVQSR